MEKVELTSKEKVELSRLLYRELSDKINSELYQIFMKLTGSSCHGERNEFGASAGAVNYGPGV